MRKIVAIIAVLLGSLLYVHAQFNSIDNTRFNLMGKSKRMSESSFLLTDFEQGATSAAWYRDVINLSYDFDFTFTLEQWGGADGMVFVMQQDGNNLFAARNGCTLGYYNNDQNTVLYNHSVGVEFDLYKNKGNWFDKDRSHIALVKNKDPQPLEGPFTISPRLGLGNQNKVRIVWQAANKKLNLFLNEALLFSHEENFVQTVFENNPRIYFGFTAATGNRAARQSFSVNKLTVNRPDVNEFYMQGATYSADGDKCLTLTTPESNSVSASWYKNAISLREDFDMTFNTTQRGTADGLMFVLQQDGNRAYQPNISGGGDLGYYNLGTNAVTNLYNRSVGIEMDIYQNDGRYNDPNNSHIALVKNKNATPLKGPFTISNPSLGDGGNNTIRIVWKAASKQLSFYLNGTQVFAHTEDFINTVFDKNPLVYFGFTASTGDYRSMQTICPDKLLIKAIPNALASVEFKGNWNGDYPELKWKTTGEANTLKFVVQQSKDGVVFNRVGDVRAVGLGDNSYNYIDNSANKSYNTLYYRLQTVDNLSNLTYSNIIELRAPIVQTTPVITEPTLPTNPPYPPIKPTQPVQEIEFPTKVSMNLTGNWDANIPSIQWLAQGEQNMSHYYIERSADGANFNIVSQVISQGDGNHNYSFKDIAAANLKITAAYYRIKAIDKKGGNLVSNVFYLAAKTQIEPPYRSNATISLTGKWLTEYPILQWQVKDEQNINTYQIERTSDKVNFVKVGEISSQGDGNRQYAYSDISAARQAGTTVYYYRVKAIDKKGVPYLSNVINVFVRLQDAPDSPLGDGALFTVVDFTGKPFKDSLLLQWRTMNEAKPNSNFVLQKSVDNSAFSRVSQLPIKQGATNTYRFIDEKAQGIIAPKVIYKLYLLDKDNKLTLLKTLDLSPKNSPIKPEQPVQDFETQTQPPYRSNATISLTGKWLTEYPILQWQVRDEQNINTYQIERTSDKVNFVKVGEISSQGDGNRQYAYSDISAARQAGTTVYYYRVKAIDKKGTSYLSNVVNVFVRLQDAPDSPLGDGVLFSVVDFVVKPYKDSVLVQWRTINEAKENTSFVLQKSVDKSAFIKVAQIPTREGTSNAYRFVDEKAQGIIAPKVIYKLYLLDKDNKLTLLKTLDLSPKIKVLEDNN